MFVPHRFLCRIQPCIFAILIRSSTISPTNRNSFYKNLYTFVLNQKGQNALKGKTIHIHSNILRLLRQGDEKAFEYLFHHYYNQIYTFVLNTLFDKTFAEDITQSVFVSLWEKREMIDPEAKIAPLLYTIARNHVYRQTEQLLLKYKYEQSQQENMQESNDIEEDLNNRFLENILSEFIEKLPSERRRIFLLSRKENLSNKEIASRLNISEKTVETQIRRSLIFLREKMKYYLNIVLL
ncbi:RNA polymerase sigma-70 factor, ECF subfamily [Porphyromonadaceae bacterium KH3CP3RA]|nr:RNA polymerase sigma-70 factor, ECF subfamily [Porphyromonadaceae bacterium KH3CP3RA]